ncbi:hypothetical protein UCRPA7_6185 [Phaeoacremonium minimum UCRPA7]|uniref:Uncharacterized protein n=1 Tax=Phaeoacremonium minimum (strain UCR-PA7) TaxID=1286976 RepID=R8BG85_PHAM7|nr:hypothetical protein UCRPA7_6185 [Phaeoacremonium minimum UCRPA7]EON98309.1 hypothetical protein UCRPA7_6185 [Phaeoacremonium minimum UCRPA7]
MNDVTDYLHVSSAIDATGFKLNLPAESQVRNASLSNGAYLLGGPKTYNLNISFPYTSGYVNSSDPRDKTLSFIEQPDLLKAALADFFVIYTNDTSGPVAAPFRAVEVLMHFCVNTYAAAVREGVSQTTRLASGTNVTESTNSADLLSLSGDGRNFTINTTYALLLGDYLRQTLSGTYSLRLGDQAVGRTGASDAVGAALYVGDLLKSLTESNNDALRHQAIRNITENVAISLSNTIRGQGTTEIGTVFITETYVCVQWAWLVCVAAQIMMSAVFVVGVMIQTSVWKVKVVKSSALATMLALNTEDKGRLERENMGQVTEPRTMSTRLRSAKAKFSLQEDGSWSLNLDSGHEPAG